MEHLRDYYDADAVANEYAARRAEKEPPTFCDCGAEAEPGQEYCRACLDVLGAVMRDAIGSLRCDAGFTEEEAEQAVGYWMENMEEFKEGKGC